MSTLYLVVGVQMSARSSIEFRCLAGCQLRCRTCYEASLSRLASSVRSMRAWSECLDGTALHDVLPAFLTHVFPHPHSALANWIPLGAGGNQLNPRNPGLLIVDC